MPELTFESEIHEYRLDGIVIPSVTQVLTRLYGFAGIPDPVLDLARERGSFVHKATEFDDLGDLDDASVPAEWMGYIEGWRRFKRESGFVPILIEEMEFDDTMWFAGTPDRVGRLTLLERAPMAVLDLKAVSEVSPVTALQLAGYEWMLARKFGSLLRYAVQLFPTGLYKLHPFINSEDTSVFMSELCVRNWRARHGI